MECVLLLTILLSVALSVPLPHTRDCSEVYVVDHQEADYWQGRVIINVDNAVNGWLVKLQFDEDVTSIDCALATVSGSGNSWTLSNRDFDGDLEAGITLELGVIVHHR